MSVILAKYALLLAAALFISAFFLLLPDLTRCSLAAEEEAKGRRVCVPPLVLTALYAVIAFARLGNTTSPQSFREFEGDGILLELEEESEIDSMLLFTGINTGSYVLEYSADGENYFYLGELEQKYDSLLKWESVPLQEPVRARYLRIFAAGKPWLGEAAVFRNGEKLAFASQCQLTDEQNTVPDRQTYMNSSYFDEIYHVRTAVENLNGLYPYELSHPPLGKLLISAGMKLWGVTPFGWRFSGTLLGVMMLPLMYVFLRKLFGGELIPLCGMSLTAFDFMHFTQTRIATIDTYAVFFTLLMYLCMYLFVSGKAKRPRLCLGLSGVFFGLGAASKWTCLYAGAGLALIWLGYWVLRFLDESKREDKNMAGVFRELCGNVLFCLAFFVAIPAAIYYVSYIPYGAARGMSGVGMLFSREYARLVLDNQSFMLRYHVSVTASHPYASRWYQWILDIRPILYYLQSGENGTSSRIAAFVNPALCWGGLLAMVLMGCLAVIRRDRKAAFILIGYLAQLLPWLAVERVTFEYHYFNCTVFLALALSYAFSLVKNAYERGWLYPIAYSGFSAALFALFYPVLSGTGGSSALLGWFSTWPL